MSSNPIRGIRRKKSSLTEVKLAVLGAPGVGKSGKPFKYYNKKYNLIFSSNATAIDIIIIIL